jgi:hypothetical protein
LTGLKHFSGFSSDFSREKPELPGFSGKNQNEYFFMKNIIFEYYKPSLVDIN